MGWIQDLPEEGDEGSRSFPWEFPLLASGDSAPENRDTGAREEARKGFHMACARLRLTCPRQPSSHTQEATGCLDLEQAVGRGIDKSALLPRGERAQMEKRHLENRRAHREGKGMGKTSSSGRTMPDHLQK